MSTLSTPPTLLEAIQLSEETWQSGFYDLIIFLIPSGSGMKAMTTQKPGGGLGHKGMSCIKLGFLSV